jgi:hypothetical protein
MVFVLFYLGYYLDNITDLEQSRIDGGPELFLYTSQVSYTTMMLIYMEQEYFKRRGECAFFAVVGISSAHPSPLC